MLFRRLDGSSGLVKQQSARLFLYSASVFTLDTPCGHFESVAIPAQLQCRTTEKLEVCLSEWVLLSWTLLWLATEYNISKPASNSQFESSNLMQFYHHRHRISICMNYLQTDWSSSVEKWLYWRRKVIVLTIFRKSNPRLHKLRRAEGERTACIEDDECWNVSTRLLIQTAFSLFWR